MIDLHLHTTASDGACTPADLVARARTAGITTMAVTDHDTGAAIRDVERLARAAGIAVVPGIEITAVWDGSDVHMLAYFVDPEAATLSAFLAKQRADRERRARLIGERLAALGVPVDIDRIMADAWPAAISRPLIASAMAGRGHVPGVREAFDAYLAEGASAYVPRIGSTPGDVVALVNAGGGAVSLAHPGVTKRDEIIPHLARNGLAALEAYHSDHDAAAVAKYRAMAAMLGLAVTGGSDFHGTDDCARQLAAATLPPDDFEGFCRRAGRAGWPR